MFVNFVNINMGKCKICKVLKVPRDSSFKHLLMFNKLKMHLESLSITIMSCKVIFLLVKNVVLQ